MIGELRAHRVHHGGQDAWGRPAVDLTHVRPLPLQLATESMLVPLPARLGSVLLSGERAPERRMAPVGVVPMFGCGVLITAISAYQLASSLWPAPWSRLVDDAASGVAVWPTTSSWEPSVSWPAAPPTASASAFAHRAGSCTCFEPCSEGGDESSSRAGDPEPPAPS